VEVRSLANGCEHAILGAVTTTIPLEHEALIRRVLGTNFLEIKLVRQAFEELPEAGSTVKLTITESGAPFEVEGKGVGVVDALFAALLARYGREYQSLTSIRVIGFHIAADIDTKKANHGVDAVGKVTLDATNSEGKHFSFTDASRSVTASTARTVIAMVEYFVNAERAFLTLHNARRDALARGREDLVSRYTAEMAEVVESTSYAEVIANIRKELG
jgi:hypothetical protein